MRFAILRRFSVLIEPHLSSINSLAIVGGSRQEAELEVLPNQLASKAVVFGIDDECDRYLDLNLAASSSDKFDLVLCSQVLEHIWNLEQAFENLSQLITDNGKLWVACPASNRAHGSPGYFSAGYQPELISKVAEKFKLETLASGKLGSERCYFMTHGLSVWPSEREHMRPILNYEFSRLPGPSWKNLLRFVRDLPGRVMALGKNSTIGDDVRFATETFVLLQKSSSISKE